MSVTSCKISQKYLSPGLSSYSFVNEMVIIQALRKLNGLVFWSPFNDPHFSVREKR